MADWLQVPVCLGFVAVVLFTHSYLGTGRVWLLWTIIFMRSAIFVVNLFSYLSFNFSSIDSVRRITVLGEEVTIIGTAVLRGYWQLFALASLFLVMAYLIDAAVRRWR